MTVAQAASGIAATDVAVVGAGPYGLSIAAHLRAAGVALRVFGSPMDVWRTQMPQSMALKSEGFACDLYDPSSELTLRKYCADHSLAYADVGLPVKLQTFCSYGLAFARRFVPELDESNVVRLEQTATGFELETQSGEIVRANRVIVAVGISHYAHFPELFSALGPQFASHSSRFHDYRAFAGRRVLVVGAGASAVDVSLSLHEAGAHPTLIARAPKLLFHKPPELNRSLWKRLRYPRSGIGNSWKTRILSDMPDAFYRLPYATRVWLVHNVLGPAPGWWTREPFERHVPAHTGWSIESVNVQRSEVHVRASDSSGRSHVVDGDYLIAATGYRADLRRLSLLSPALRSSIRSRAGVPILSPRFESSVDGLYFVGLSSAMSFGPLMRFAYGAGFTARRLTAHLARVTAGSAGA